MRAGSKIIFKIVSKLCLLFNFFTFIFLFSLFQAIFTVLIFRVQKHLFKLFVPRFAQIDLNRGVVSFKLSSFVTLFSYHVNHLWSRLKIMHHTVFEVKYLPDWIQGDVVVQKGIFVQFTIVELPFCIFDLLNIYCHFIKMIF